MGVFDIKILKKHQILHRKIYEKNHKINKKNDPKSQKTIKKKHPRRLQIFRIIRHIRANFRKFRLKNGRFRLFFKRRKRIFQPNSKVCTKNLPIKSPISVSVTLKKLQKFP
jgi:hypothetical protein